jgi:hypothetical protein
LHITINVNGELEVDAPMGKVIIIGFASSIFGDGFVVERKLY